MKNEYKELLKQFTVNLNIRIQEMPQLAKRMWEFITSRANCYSVHFNSEIILFSNSRHVSLVLSSFYDVWDSMLEAFHSKKVTVVIIIDEVKIINDATWIGKSQTKHFESKWWCNSYVRRATPARPRTFQNF